MSIEAASNTAKVALHPDAGWQWFGLCGNMLFTLQTGKLRLVSIQDVAGLMI
jgi:hypothetical protein